MAAKGNRKKKAASGVIGGSIVAFGSIGATFLLFAFLPIINRIAEGKEPDTELRSIDTSAFPDEPDVVEEEEPEPEEESEEEPPPELVEEPQELSLAELELALNPAAGLADGIGANVAIDIERALGGAGGGVDELFSAADLDNKPSAINKEQPSLNAREKKATPGNATVIFIVDKRGRVKSPKVTKSSHPDLVAAALRTVKKWRFEPGTRKGKPVEFRMRQRMTFPEQR